MSVRSTSKKSLREVIESGLLGDMQKMVYEALHSYGPCTANELFYKHLVRRKKINQANITTRLGELRAMGSAIEQGKRVCTVTGKRVIVWECSHAMPIKYVKPKSAASRVRELRSLVRGAQIMAEFYGEFLDDEEDEAFLDDWEARAKAVLSE